MDPLVSVIPGDCMEIRAGKHLEYHTSSGSCIHNHLPFMSVSKKVSVNFISTVHWSHPYYFQVFAFVFIRKISPGIFWHETHGIFFASMFCPSQISRHPSIPMPKWTWWDGHLNLSMEGKFHPTKKNDGGNTRNVSKYMAYIAQWKIGPFSRCWFLLKKGRIFPV